MCSAVSRPMGVSTDYTFPEYTWESAVNDWSLPKGFELIDNKIVRINLPSGQALIKEVDYEFDLNCAKIVNVYVFGSTYICYQQLFDSCNKSGKISTRGNTKNGSVYSFCGQLIPSTQI